MVYTRRAFHPLSGKLETVSMYNTGSVWVCEFKDGRILPVKKTNFLQGKRAKRFNLYDHNPEEFIKTQKDKAPSVK